MIVDKNSVSVSDYYDAAAEDYHRQYQRSNLYSSGEYPANYFRLQILIRLLSASAAKRVYEVGVGEGTPLLTMAKAGLEVAGCDISENMVIKARENFRASGLSERLISWGDVEDSTSSGTSALQRKV